MVLTMTLCTLCKLPATTSKSLTDGNDTVMAHGALLRRSVRPRRSPARFRHRQLQEPQSPSWLLSVSLPEARLKRRHLPRQQRAPPTRMTMSSRQHRLSSTTTWVDTTTTGNLLQRLPPSRPNRHPSLRKPGRLPFPSPPTITAMQRHPSTRPPRLVPLTRPAFPYPWARASQVLLRHPLLIPTMATT
jgi:hypothetical protein